MKQLTQRVNFLEGPIFQSLLIFAIPLFISTVFQQLYNTADVIVIGNTLGDSSLAAIGSTTAIYDLLVGFCLGVGNGLAIVTARSFGAKDETLIRKSVAGAIVIGSVISCVTTLLAQVLLYPLLKLLNTPMAIIQEAYSYISLITLFIIVMFAYNLCAGLLRAIGNSLAPLVFLIISALLNIILNVFFIVYLQTGIKGAAIATIISQGISALLCIHYIYRKNKMLVPTKTDFSWDKALYKELLAQGLSMGFMSAIVSAGSVILQYGINGLGFLTIAGHTAARRIYQFCLMPLIAMGMALSTFVSQNKGANQIKRIRQSVKIVMIYQVLMTIALVIVVGFFAPILVQVISGSQEALVLSNGTLYLRVVTPFFAILGILLSLRFALQGIGEKMLPLISSVIEFFWKNYFCSSFYSEVSLLSSYSV